MIDYQQQRHDMVTRQIAARGIKDAGVLRAMEQVPRELFIAPELLEYAYNDTPLPIEEGQTISQPYIVALIIEALHIGPNDRVLDIGAGSGYQSALLGKIAKEVYAIERHEALVELAAQRLRTLGLDNVHVLLANGTLGHPPKAPYDAIAVAAGGPGAPQSLLDQLAIGGRLVIPIGEEINEQRLVRFVRSAERKFDREDLCPVRFVPLIGAEGWREDAIPPNAQRSARRPAAITPPRPPATNAKRAELTVDGDTASEVIRALTSSASIGREDRELAGAADLRRRPPAELSRLIRETAQPFSDIETADLGGLLERIGDARVVLLGEATHGTSEFYRMRARITRELVLRRGFNVIAVEADWPDAERIDRYVRHRPRSRHEWRAFTRFPTWMWRNQEILELIEWLRAHNDEVRDPARQAGFYGLDLYSLYTSAAAVVRYLEEVDPATAKVARERYGCLSPWETDPAAYGRAALTGKYRECEQPVIAMLRELLEKRSQYTEHDGERFIDAVQNAHLVANAEQYYRAMYYGSTESWNLRDRHMFDTLNLILGARGVMNGAPAKAIIWAHNSHVGDAAATEMGARGEINIGQLCRAEFGDGAFIVGFGTDHGTVVAASQWDGPREVKDVRPSHPESYELLAHGSDVPAFLLHLRNAEHAELRPALSSPRLERAIGVIYRPETELPSHYFQAMLPAQFDEYIWFDESHALEPLQEVQVTGVPETYPFGL